MLKMLNLILLLLLLTATCTVFATTMSTNLAATANPANAILLTAAANLNSNPAKMTGEVNEVKKNEATTNAAYMFISASVFHQAMKGNTAGDEVRNNVICPSNAALVAGAKMKTFATPRK